MTMKKDIVKKAGSRIATINTPQRRRTIIVAVLMAGLTVPVGMRVLKASASTGRDSLAERTSKPSSVPPLTAPVSAQPGPATGSNPDAVAAGSIPSSVPASSAPVPEALAALAPQASPSPTPTVQTLHIWMYGGYFYPRTIYAKPGPTLIAVQNQTLTNVTLALLPYGAPASSASTVSTQTETNSSVGGAPPLLATGVVNLSVGEYVYYDKINPAMQGVIVVKASQ